MRYARPVGLQAADERVKASDCQSSGLLTGCSSFEITKAVEQPLFYHTSELHQTGPRTKLRDNDVKVLIQASRALRPIQRQVIYVEKRL